MTTSLELSKALFEKGLKIETEKWWCRLTPNMFVENSKAVRKYTEDEHRWELCIEMMGYKSYPAPSTDELLAAMPQYIYDRQNMLTIVKNDNRTYWVGYSNHEGIAYKKEFSDTFLPEALGKMCLWLLKNGYYFNGKELIREEKQNASN